MSITDKQVEAALKQLPLDYPTTLPPYVVKNMIEAAMQSAWVKFDPDDETTWPPLDGGGMRSIRVITNGGDICELIYTNKQWIYLLSYELNPVTHWARLPVFIQ